MFREQGSGIRLTRMCGTMQQKMLLYNAFVAWDRTAKISIKQMKNIKKLYFYLLSSSDFSMLPHIKSYNITFGSPARRPKI